MSEPLGFLNSHLFWPVLLGGTLLWMVFIWKEWTKVLHVRFYLKILVALFTLSCLAMMVLRPMVRNSAETYPAILLTEGYDEERLDSLREIQINAKILTYAINRPIGTILDS
ncbi:MAG: hypothetical protein WA913_03085, partial [Pricia sp.]